MSPSVLSRLAALALLCSVVGDPAAAAAQPPARIGFLGMDSKMQAEWLDAFRDGLRTLGYVEGRTIVIEYRWAEGRFDQLPRLASELVDLKPAVIVTAAPPAVNAVRHATTTIPIVMSVHDPVGMGFAASFAHPGGNITGVAFQDTELSTKRLDLLRLAVPRLARVAIVWNKVGGGVTAVQAVEASARSLGLQTLALEVQGADDFGTAIEKAKSWGAQGVAQLASPVITYNRRLFLQLLATHRLPATCEMRRYVVEGCLMSYSANLASLFRRMSYYVDRVLKGANPAALPIEQPREFECVINLRTAKALGLNIPKALLLQTDETIE